MKSSNEITVTNVAVAVLACLINCLIMGTMRLSTLLFVATLDNYDVSRDDAALPFFLVTTVRAATGPIIGFLGKKHGPRLVTLFGCIFCFIGIAACYFAEGMLIVNIFWGGMFGLGAGLGTILLPQILSQHFKKHLDKANGLCMGGECLSGVLAPGPFNYLLFKFGLSGTYLMMSSIVLHAIPSALFLKLLEPSKNKHSQNSELSAIKLEDRENLSNENQNLKIKDMNNKFHLDVCSKNNEYQRLHKNDLNLPVRQEVEHDIKHPNTNKIETSICKSLNIFLNPIFIFIMFTQSMSIFIAISVYTVLVDFGRDAQIQPHQEIYPVIVYAVADFIGRLGAGFVTDGKYISRINFTVLSYFVIGIIQMILSHLVGLTSVLITVFIYALFLGSNFTVSSGIVVEFVKSENLSMAFSCRYLLCAPFSLIISPLIGYFREQQGSYEGLFYLIGSVAFVCSVLTFLIPVVARRRQK